MGSPRRTAADTTAFPTRVAARPAVGPVVVGLLGAGTRDVEQTLTYVEDGRVLDEPHR